MNRIVIQGETRIERIERLYRRGAGVPMYPGRPECDGLPLDRARAYVLGQLG